jgi:hypothetical protein
MLELRGPCDVGGLQQLTLGLRLIIGYNKPPFEYASTTRLILSAATVGSSNLTLGASRGGQSSFGAEGM